MNARRKLICSAAFSVCLMSACSTQQMLQAVQQKDPGNALQSLAQSRVNAYKYDPELVLKDIKRAQTEYNRLRGRLQNESGAKWGKKEAQELPSRMRYVKYTEDYKNRVIVDFGRDGDRTT